MDKVREVGEPEASDDSVSLTSTVSSEKVGDYEVERILAERRNNGAVEYLTAWKNYQETSHSWEPKQNFNTTDTFNDWDITKIQVAKGLERPFDVKAWEKRCKTIIRETCLRRERRRVKKLRLIMEDELDSGLGRQEADIEGLDPGPAPKLSNKSIKRKSVHYDSPPSSSASISSSSSTEDSDRPLVSRQKAEIFTPNAKWTEAETIALEEGLRRKGPYWNEILILYGRGGTINQVLREKTRSDLYEKAKSLHQEFVDSGREPPEYLKSFSKITSSKGSRTATPKACSDSRCESRAVSKKSRSTSTDSMMAELYEKQRIREELSADETLKQTTRTTQVNSHPKKAAPHSKNITEGTKDSNDHSHQNRQSEGGPRVEEPSQMNAIPQLGREPESQVPGEKDLANSRAAAASTVPEENMRGEIARTIWSGTARAQTARPLASDLSRRGVGSEPTRPSTSKPKRKLGQIEPKKPSTTGDVTAGWNAEPKKRRSNSWATQNAEPVDGQSTQRHYKLSVQNKLFKKSRDGRVPDPNRLVFIDPKTGKAPTTVPAPSAITMLSKTPLQLHQDGNDAREPQERRAQEIVGTSEPDPPPQSIDQNDDVVTNQQSPSRTGVLLSNAFSSASRPSTGHVAEDPPGIGTPTLASSHRGLPSYTPLGPRIETKKTVAMSLQEYTQRPKPSTHQLNEAPAMSHPPQSPDQPSMFTLRVYPLLEQRKQLFHTVERNLVIGEIKLAKDTHESIDVKLVGFEAEVRRLLLTIKRLPQIVDFVFDTVCLASEYQKYFSVVSTCYHCLVSLQSYSLTPERKTLNGWGQAPSFPNTTAHWPLKV